MSDGQGFRISAESPRLANGEHDVNMHGGGRARRRGVQIDYFAHHLGRDRSPTPSRDTPAAPPVTHSIDLSLSVDAQVAMRFSNGRTDATVGPPGPVNA